MKISLKSWQVDHAETAPYSTTVTKLNGNTDSNARLIRLKEALDDVLSSKDSMEKFMGCVGHEIADHCYAIQSSLRAKVFETLEGPQSSTSYCSGDLKSAVRVPAVPGKY